MILAVFLAALLYGWALESEPPEAGAAAGPSQRSPAGQRLYLLIVDSLSVDDLPALPAMEEIGRAGFSATVEPCADKFTTACVREALTGRTHASLFSVLENFKVLAPSLGANLIDDARGLGLKTALVSGGNLRTWSGRVDSDLRVGEGASREEELALGLEAIETHDIVIHHWIWLDVASHHRRGEPERYEVAQAETNALVAALSERLRPEVGLVVTGDHGHTPDGRHIEGLDTPTAVAVRSPNLRPARPEGRIPITALRYLSGAVAGVPAASMEVGSEYSGWLADPSRPAALSAASPDVGPRRGLVFGAAVLLGALALALVDPRAAALALTWAVAQGLTFQALIQHFGQRGRGEDFVSWCWLVPPLVGALAWLRERRAEALVWGTAVGGAALFIGLWPGLARFAVFRNLAEILAPCLVVALLAGLHRARDRRALGAGALLFAGVMAVELVFQFGSNHFRIREYPFEGLDQPEWAGRVIAAGLGGAAASLMDRRLASALAGAAAAAAGPLLPPPLQALAAAGLLLALASDSPRAAGLLGIAASGFMMGLSRQIGVLALGLYAGVVFTGLRRFSERGGVGERALPWLGALVLLSGAYLGLAFTMGLTVGGINFNFALPWFPERWHVRLWWMVAAATLLKLFLPALLFGAVGRLTFEPGAWGRMLGCAARLAMLRFVVSAVLLSAWIGAASPTLASSRLRGLLFDGFGWLLTAAVFGLLAAGSRRAPGASG